MRREQSGKCNNGVEGLPELGSPRTLARASAPIWVGTGAGSDAAALGCSRDNDPRMVLARLMHGCARVRSGFQVQLGGLTSTSTVVSCVGTGSSMSRSWLVASFRWEADWLRDGLVSKLQSGLVSGVSRGEDVVGWKCSGSDMRKRESEQ